MSTQDGLASDARPVDEMSFEAAMSELEAIVDKLEKGNVPLEESIAYYERGEALRTRCDALLKSAELRVEKVRLKAGQGAGTEPFDEPEPAPRSARRKPAEDEADDIPF